MGSRLRGGLRGSSLFELRTKQNIYHEPTSKRAGKRRRREKRNDQTMNFRIMSKDGEDVKDPPEQACQIILQELNLDMKGEGRRIR